MLREQKGWSQRELARRCGFASSLIGKYEAGEIDPTSTNVRALSEIFEVSSDYLLGLSDDPKGPRDTSELTADDEAVLTAFRRDGWLGIVRLGVEHLK